MRKFDPKTLPKDSSKAVPGTFYHGVFLDGEFGFYAALNLLESGMLQTPNYLAYWDSNFASKHRSASAEDIKDLRYKGQNSGGLTPTAMNCINAASGIRQGLHIKMGSARITDVQEKKIIDKSRIEIKFEMERRKYAKNAVSRLECLYVADNQSVIKEMFRHHPDLLILKVKIAEALNYTRADSRWYDEYDELRSRKCIKKYWNGQKYDENISTWEYLVDGLIIIDDPKGLNCVNSLKEELEEEFNYRISSSQRKSLFMAYVL